MVINLEGFCNAHSISSQDPALLHEILLSTNDEKRTRSGRFEPTTSKLILLRANINPQDHGVVANLLFNDFLLMLLQDLFDSR